MKNVLSEKSIWKILNFMAALERKSETTKFDYNFDCERSLKIYVSHFSVTVFESLSKNY